MYNRKQRREAERNTGMLKIYQEMSEAEKSEVRLRRKLAGEQIHAQFIQNSENARLEAAANYDAEIINRYIASGMTEEDAKRIVENNYAVQQKRADKLRKRKQK